MRHDYGIRKAPACGPKARKSDPDEAVGTEGNSAEQHLDSTTQNVGNSSYTTGTNSNGQGWSSTTHNYGGGNSTTYSTDSRGNTTTRSCFGGICN